MKNRLLLPFCAALTFGTHVDIVRAQSPSPVPVSAGQAAFGAISEVLSILKADPATDWTKVNIEALRQHLIDMDAVVMQSDIAQKDIAGGIDAQVTGNGKTIGSIQRLASNHTSMLNGMPEYRASVVSLPTGVRVSITARDPNDTKTVARIRGLGFAGLLTEGMHHQRHHLAMARGEMVHEHK